MLPALPNCGWSTVARKPRLNDIKPGSGFQTFTAMYVYIVIFCVVPYSITLFSNVSEEQAASIIRAEAGIQTED
jgi:hypothetical protein